MYAVLETGGKQYRVVAGDTLEIERLPVEAGQSFTFDRVLMVGNEGKFTFGGPTIAGAGVDRKSTRLNSSHSRRSRMPSSA